MIRKGFSVYLVRSARYGTTLQLSSLMHKLLLTWADTSPDVADYTVNSPTFDFVDRGKARQTSVPICVKTRSGRTRFLDMSTYGLASAPSLSRQVKQAHAEQSGADYEVFDRDRFNQNYVEKKNRQSAQNLLYMAHGLNTSELQANCLMALGRAGARTVQDLAAAIETSPTKMLVVALRLWLENKVSLPLTTQLMQPSWTVERIEYARP